MSTVKILHFIEKQHLLKPGEKVLVAFSGGPDSTYLLLELRKIWRNVSAVYINHSLRGKESVKEEEFVRNFCKRKKIELFVEHLKWKQPPSNLEEAARKKRYACFEKVAAEHGFQKIALAHHLDDQVETFLLRLMRGSGAAGLSGMQPVRGPYIRPLLTTRKNEILESLKRNRIRFILDSTNTNLKIMRNRVRKELIPYVEKHFNPRFIEAVERAVESIQEQKELAFDAIVPMLRIVHDSNHGLWIEREPFCEMNDRTQKAVLREAISRLYPTQFTSRFLKAFMQAIVRKQTLDLPGYLKLECSKDRIILTRNKKHTGSFEMHISAAGNYLFPPGGCRLKFTLLKDTRVVFSRNTAWIDAAKAPFPLVVRNWRKGDRFQPLGMKGKKKLSDYWIDRKVPRNERKKIPLLLKDDDLIWIGGHQIDHKFRITPESESVLKVEILPGTL